MRFSQRVPRSDIPVFAVGDRVKNLAGDVGTVVSYEPTTLTVGAWVRVKMDKPHGLASMGIGDVGLYGATGLTKV